ncbi:MAG: carboxypeptidase-like regulatory domain-containing protein, partial [Bacteroidia bacterium]|nr:carboxypeptidase-like regulatory domain-containing protein [Bacteroidia bacterium]
MKHFFTLLLFTFSISVFSQNGEIKGVIKDEATGETVIGATVMIAEGKGVVTDINGNYSIKADSGTYIVTVSFVGYETQKAKVKVGNKPVSVNFSLKTK